jgi:hypothetical protein
MLRFAHPADRDPMQLNPVIDAALPAAKVSRAPALPEIHEFLGCRTPDAWVEAALADQETMLLDHKNCEKKSAMQLRIVRRAHAA